MAIPMGPGNTEKQLQFMIDMQSTVFTATASYALLIAEEVEKRGIRDQIHLRKLITGSERAGDKIRKRIIDGLGATVEFDATGALKSDVTKELLTKNELGDDYNMVAWGGAKAEWYVQVEYFANYCIGKTADQVLAGYSEDVDLTTSATIKLGGYAQAVAAAVENAKHLGAKAGDELKMATVSSLSASANNAIELDCDMVVMTMKDGSITSCYLDALQAKVAVDATGVATVGNTQTKNELGDNYNMVAWGGAKYEWYQQAENFCTYVTGKTPADVAGIAVNESTKPADGTDLATTVTIAIAGFQALVAKAAG